MERLYENDRDRLLRRFRDWRHWRPAAPDRVRFGDGTDEALLRVVDGLERFVHAEVRLPPGKPLKLNYDASFRLLSANLIPAVRDLLDDPGNADHGPADRLVQSTETFFRKLLLVARDRFSEGAIGPLIKHLTDEGLLAYKDIPGQDFVALGGWVARNSADNTIRDLVGAKHDLSHRCSVVAELEFQRGMGLGPDTDGRFTESLLAAFLIAIDHNIATIEARCPSLPPAGDRIDRPEHRYCPTGLPARRRIHVDGASGLFRSRMEALSSWRETFGGILGSGTGHVLVVKAPPGWGKTTGMALALEHMDGAIYFLDLEDARDMPGVGQAIEFDFYQSDEPRFRRPSQMLHTALQRRTLIVLENLYRNADGRAPKGLDRFVSDLVDLGHVVVLESWIHPAEILGRFHPSTVTEVPPLPQVDREEVRAWAQMVLKNPAPLAESDLDDLELLGGNPLWIKSVLESLAGSGGAGAREGLALDLIGIVERALSIDEAFEGFLAGRTPGDGALPAVLAVPFALLPYGSVGPDDLDETGVTTLQIMALICLVHHREGRWFPGPWARTLAIKRLLAEPALMKDQRDRLEALAALAPPVHAAAQARHLFTLAARLPDWRDFLTTIAHALPEPVSTGEEAPSPDPADDATTELGLALLGESRIPASIALWMAESSARRDQSDTAATFVDWVLGSDDPQTTRCLTWDWTAVKALHTVLLRIDRPVDWKVERYESACVIIGMDPETDPAYRAWCARFLARAAAQGFLVRRTQAGRAWLSRARSLQDGLPAPPPGTVSALLHRDTEYRIASAPAVAADSFQALVRAHAEAFRTIPVPELDSAPDMSLEERRSRRPYIERESVWFRRAMRHLRILVQAGEMDEVGAPGASRTRLRNLDAWLDRLPLSLAWLEEYGRLADHVEELDEDAAELLRKALDRKLTENAGLDALDWRIRQLAMMWRNPALEARKAVQILRQVARLEGTVPREAIPAGDEPEEPSPLDSEDLALGLLCIRWISRFPKVLDRHRKAACDACEALLEEFKAHPEAYRDSSTAAQLRRRCLRFIAMRELGLDLADTEDDAFSPASWKRINDALRRIDGMYLAHVEDDDEATWLWEDWARWRLAIYKRKIRLENDYHKRREGQAMPLSETTAMADLEKALELLADNDTGHPVFDLGAFRIQRYLWRFEAALERAERLLAQPLGRGHRVTVVQAVVEAFAPACLEPVVFQSPSTLPHVPRTLSLFGAALSEYALVIGRKRERRWAEATATALAAGTDRDYWQALVEEAEERIGNPKEYWARILAALENDDPDDERAARILDDLTDVPGMTLAGLLFRYGAGQEGLDADLRFRLAQLSVAVAAATGAWSRTTRQRQTNVQSWHLGSAIGLGLILSPDRKLFGTHDSHRRTKKGGVPISWKQSFDQLMNRAQMSAMGTFAEHVRDVYDDMKAKMKTRS